MRGLAGLISTSELGCSEGPAGLALAGSGSCFPPALSAVRACLDLCIPVAPLKILSRNMKSRCQLFIHVPHVFNINFTFHARCVLSAQWYSLIPERYSLGKLKFQCRGISAQSHLKSAPPPKSNLPPHRQIIVVRCQSGERWPRVCSSVRPNS